ncbi:hypothetical protein MHY1_01036 [Methylovirgula sp. HY1]|nr:hypothetical protein MHY1_01036 [Methylovirgula sp. HY1]
MLPFEFEAALFQFDAREPEFAALPKLPPRITATNAACIYLSQPLIFTDLIQAPRRFPTDASSASAARC